jgi:hypothetical protein
MHRRPWLILQQRDGDRGHRIDASSQGRLGKRLEMAVVRTRKFFARSFRPSELGGVHGAKPKHDGGNPVDLQVEKTKVFAGHTRWIVGYMFRAKRSNQRRLDPRRQRAIVDRDRASRRES